MDRDDRAKASACFVAGLPLAAWFLAARAAGDLERGGFTAMIRAAELTARGERPLLVVALLVGFAVAAIGVVLARRVAAAGFGGAAFRLHLRGTRVAGARRLAWSTRERRR
jgi:hypothetical protein